MFLSCLTVGFSMCMFDQVDLIEAQWVIIAQNVFDLGWLCGLWPLSRDMTPCTRKMDKQIKQVCFVPLCILALKTLQLDDLINKEKDRVQFGRPSPSKFAFVASKVI